MSPTQLSTKILRDLKIQYEIVEHWNEWAKCRKDLFGFIDILAMVPRSYLLGIQATTFGNRHARIDKIMASPYIHGWLSTGNKVQVWTYRETKKEKGMVFDSIELIDGALIQTNISKPFNFIV